MSVHSEAKTSKPKIFFENLDALRTIACLSVFIAHSMLGTTLKNLWDNDFYKRFVSFFSTGALGVSFFFVLSGFLITYLILLEYKEENKFSFRNFYIRRVLRIWPLYYFVVIFGFFIYPYFRQVAFGIDSKFPNIFAYHLFFLSNFDAINIQSQNLLGLSPMMIAITWSVSIEEQFYLVWPLLFFLLPRFLYPYIFIFIILFSSFFRFYYMNVIEINYYHSFSVMSDLAIGGFCAYGALYSKNFIIVIEKIPKFMIIIFYIIGILYLMYIDVIVKYLPYSYFYGRIIQTCFFAFIIMEQNYNKNSLLKYSKLRLLSNFGKYTYGMYMLHPIGIQCSVILYKVLHIDNTGSFLSGVIYAFVALCISIFMSYTSYYYFESYFLKLKNKM